MFKFFLKSSLGDVSELKSYYLYLVVIFTHITEKMIKKLNMQIHMAYINDV